MPQGAWRRSSTVPSPRRARRPCWLYGAVFEDSTDAAFAAAEEHGMRLILGKVMMDRLRYDESLG